MIPQEAELAYDPERYLEEFRQTEGRLEATRGWGKKRVGSYCLKGTEFLFGIMKKF